MRIGLFAHRLAQSRATGIGRYVRELTSALGDLAGAGHVLTLSSTPEPEATDWIPRGIETHVLPWPRGATQAAWCLGVGPTLERALGRLDVVHLLHPFPPAKTAAPLVVTVHDLFPLEHPGWYPPSERWTYRRSIALVIRRARKIVVPSRYVADRLMAVLGVGPGVVEVVPHGVNGSFATVRSDQEIIAACSRFGVEPGRFVVCVGAVSTRKNVTVLMRATAQIPGAPVPLVLIGADGHGATEVDAEAARLDGTAKVIRTGYVSDPETAALVRGAAALAHPALAEGFGMVPLEAMAAGTPVIAARASSIPEVVDDAAVLVDDPAQPGSWTSALTGVIGSAERRDELTAAGKRRAADFSWERAARTMLEIYEHTAGG
jgi:glycosyltransferase involved in cell wall biosynthesis